MNKLIFTMACLSLAVSEVHADDSSTDVLTDAIKNGKATIQIRPRAEWVDDDGAPKTDPAKAITVRTILGYKTAPIEGISVYGEVMDVSALDDNYNVNYVQPNAKYATVSDPEVTTVHQLYLSGYGVKLGKQRLIVNNSRFIGDVDWRQDGQMFTAATYEKAKLLSWLDVQAAYATKVSLVDDQTASIKLPMVNLKAHTPFGANVTLFLAAIEGREAIGQQALEANFDTTKSRAYDVLRVDGRKSNVLYDFSYGRQRDYADGSPTVVPHAGYSDIQLGYVLGPLTVRVQQEVLGRGFQTPLATLHSFNGWADRFLVTPTNGLNDRNIQFYSTVKTIDLVAAYHVFTEDAGNRKFGEEVDLSAGKKFNPHWSALIKFASYHGDGEVTTPASQFAYGQNVMKGWVQVTYNY